MPSTHPTSRQELCSLSLGTVLKTRIAHRLQHPFLMYIHEYLFLRRIVLANGASSPASPTTTSEAET